MADNGIVVHLKSSPDEAVQLVENTLRPDGWKVSWTSPGTGSLEKGNRTKALLLGAFHIHYQYHVRVTQNPDGTSAVSVFPSNSGMAGGLIGVSKVKKGLGGVRDLLAGAAQANGTLIGA
ncbi:hypothetical protein [Actinomadura parmotrematis]|uniref:SRPBCC family protein n=1 Tax=Actinomadura parmotrematis TaxID=2864039 RepID=A0ABS7FU49_9ACTN|nr:hypothetical protein [Actinomadura parmotrematis]MBW8483117.1 hypothetical protein [Actinomadura parmotrematis]